MMICIAMLSGISITLSLLSDDRTKARANPIAANTPHRAAKADLLFDRVNISYGAIQAAIPAALNVTAGPRFAFIRGGIDDAMLTWMPAKQPVTDLPHKPVRRKLRPSPKSHSKPAVRTAATAPQRQPWLLDLLIRHIARGS
ncbi:hypothetical protein ACSVBT_04255 [Afipia sp. TerB]